MPSESALEKPIILSYTKKQKAMSHKTYSYYFTIPLYAIFLVLFLHVQMYPMAYSQLDYRFHDKSCPRLLFMVRAAVWAAMRNDSRIPASLLRLHFHDCIVNGCDASVLLDDTEGFEGEKNAGPNRNSLRGFEVIDAIKEDVEKYCAPQTVSCADILTLAAREAVYMSGGPYWNVLLGRRDGTTASQNSANQQIPFPFESLKDITAKFTAKGLDSKDVVVLSGAHTIGFAQCFTFKRRLFNFKNSGNPDPTLDSSVLTNLQAMCPNLESSDTTLAPLDSQSTFRFDNSYYTNVINRAGLLESDQALLQDPKAASLATSYSKNPYLFSRDFAASMFKLSNVGVITGSQGEIRKSCRSLNTYY